MRTFIFAALLAGCNGRSVLGNGGSDLGGSDLAGSAVCGGLHGTACPAGDYCHYPSSTCGATDGTGSCLPRPQSCNDLYAPVCGCDNMTYGNSCTANAAGVDVLHDGVCETPQNTCGGLGGIACSADQYCDYPTAASCGDADGSGNCTPRPQLCSDVESPVCGCDNQSYGNACMANAAGVSVRHTGMCTTAGDCRQTGCPSGQKCELCFVNYICINNNAAC